MKFDSPEFAYGAIGTGVFLIVIIALLTVLLIRCNGNGQLGFKEFVTDDGKLTPVDSTYYYSKARKWPWPWNRRTVTTIHELPAFTGSVPKKILETGSYKNIHSDIPLSNELMTRSAARQYHSRGPVRAAGPPNRYIRATAKISDATNKMYTNTQKFIKHYPVTDPKSGMVYTFGNTQPKRSRAWQYENQY